MTTSNHIFLRDREHVYVNAVLSNDSDKSIPCKIDVTITNPVIRKSNNYKMCIVRFDVPLTSIQKTIMSSVLKNVSPACLGFIYQNRLYLYSFSIDRWPQMRTISDLIMYMRFVMMRALWTLIVVTGYGGFPTPIGATDPVYDSGPDRVINWPGAPIESYDVNQSSYVNAVPLFRWMEEPSIMELIYPIRLYADGILLVAHESLFRFIDSFPYVESGMTGIYALNNTVPPEYVAFRTALVTDEFYLDQMFPNNANYNFNTPHGDTVNSFRILQEYSVSHKFNTLEKVIIHTSMPLRQELKPDLRTSKIGGRLILTDYSVPIDKWGSVNQILHYFTTTFDRWIDLVTTEDIEDISFDFQYEDIYGNINDILLEPNQTANIKILFKSI